MEMRSEAQKAADRRYEAKVLEAGTYTRFTCKIRTDIGEAFRQACQANGTTANAVLVKAIEEYISSKNER